jgi:hypothetical protein
MPNGTIERKCTKGHNKAEGRCSPRCVRWYPRVQRTAPDGHGRRRFDYLGGYPSKAAARSALDQALRRHRGRPSDPSISFVGRHLRRSTTCWTTGSLTSKPTRHCGCEPSAATANCWSTTCAPTSAPSP